jgi:site-specific DNA recombinase
MRVATYARYSSDLQDRRSVTDQRAIMHDFARSRGWDVVADFSDEAASGSSLQGRKGLAGCLAGARSEAFAGILVESLDRLSRSLADIAQLHRGLSFLGVKLLSIADGGEVPVMMIALKGGISEQYLVDLAAKTKRGQMGRVRAGRIPGGRCYGYDVVPGDDRGLRVINEGQAAIVRRVFEEFEAGNSALDIVRRLNNEGIPGPRGSSWSVSTLMGSRQRANGILSNTLYIGRITYDRQRFIKDPGTGKRQARLNDPSNWKTQEVPELRIIDHARWDAVQARRRVVGGKPLRQRRKPRRLLSGLLTCGVCGANMIVVTKDHVACSAYRNRRTCQNNRTMRMAEIEERVLSALKEKLLAPELVEDYVRTYREERRRLNVERSRARRDVERQLTDTKRKQGSVIRGIEDEEGDRKLLGQRLKELAALEEALEAQLRQMDRPDVTELHPSAGARYRQQVADIQAELAKGGSPRSRGGSIRQGIDPHHQDDARTRSLGPPGFRRFGNPARVGTGRERD